jgi:hypothetical protein
MSASNKFNVFIDGKPVQVSESLSLIVFRLMDHTQFSKHVQKLESKSLVSVTMNAYLLLATAACAL